MPKRTSHSSRIIEIKSCDGSLSFKPVMVPRGAKSRRSHFGFDSAEDLLLWASTTESDGAERINEILQLIVELQDANRTLGNHDEHTFSWHGRVFRAKAKMEGVGPAKNERCVQLASRLNGCLSRYKLAPWYWTTLGDYPIVGFWSRTDRPRYEEDPEEDAWFTEQDAIIAIIDLAREGQLCKIRRCYCGDWFFAKFTHQKFCCPRCQQKYYRSSEDYRAMRRAYMKNLRGLHKKTYLVSPKARVRNKVGISTGERPSAGSNRNTFKGESRRRATERNEQ